MATRPAVRRRRGVTLVEILISIVILTVVLLGMGRYMVGFSRNVRFAEARSVATALAAARLSEIRASPNYTGLETAYATTESSITGFPGYTRVTTITHTGGPRPTFTNDYKTVTVTVSGTRLTSPVSKTVIVAAP